MKRRRRSSVLSEKTSSDSMKKDEETSEHEDELEDPTLNFQSTEIFSPIERRRDESSDLGEPSSDQTSHQSEAAEGLSDVLYQETETHPVPLQFLESETEEITETSEGTPRQPDTESVGSVSSIHGEGGNSLYSFHSFDCGVVVVPPPFFTHEKRNHPFFMDDSWGKPLYHRRGHSLTEEHKADAEQTLQGEEQRTPLDLSLPSNTRFINVSPPAVTSTSTADPSSSPRLDFSLPHQDESHSQYVGPSRTFRIPTVLKIPSALTYVPPRENVSTVRPPELPDVIQPMGEQYGRQNSAGNNKDEIMESVGHVSHSDPNRSASTDLPQISKVRKQLLLSSMRNKSRYQSDSATEMEEKHQEHQNKSLHQGEESSFTNVPLQTYLPLVTIAQHISDSSTQRFLSSLTIRKVPIGSGIKMETLSKKLKQTENPAADEDQLKQTEDLKQFAVPRITPFPLQQPLTTDSSKEEPISCSMDHNVPPSSDPTQSHSVPNRSASTDLLLPSGPGLRKGDLSNSSPSLLCPLTHQDPPLDISILPRAASLPNMKLQSSFEEFTPGFCGDADDETYWFQCSSPGLYQCRVSGLVFDMKGGGDVFYRVVPWNRRLLSPHGKKPAGPLFDISCQQQSVAQLHLPHCEVRSTGRCHFLSVAHLRDESVEFIRPERITETHIIISITGFSAFGNVKDEDSPPDPVRALVLLFYKPPADPESEHEINVLMLPKNVVLNNVLRFRKKLDDNERFLETPPNCKLQPNQFYSLSVSPGGNSVLVQPKEAEFDAESYENYVPTFQVVYEEMMKHVRLSLTDSSSCIVWERRVCLSAAGVRRSSGPTRQNLSPQEQLMEIRIRFMEGVSGPVLQSLLDNLLEEKVIIDSEREAVEAERTRGDRARVLIDTVRRKGDDASSKMIRFLCDLDHHFSEHLGLM